MKKLLIMGAAVLAFSAASPLVMANTQPAKAASLSDFAQGVARAFESSFPSNMDSSGSYSLHVSNKDKKHRTVNFSTGPFHYKDDRNSVDVSPVRLTGSDKKGSFGLYYGKKKLTVEAVNIKDENTALVIKGVNVKSFTQEQGDKIDAAYDFQFDSIADHKGDLGSANVRIAFKKLDTGALMEVLRLAEVAQSQSENGAMSQEQLVMLGLRAIPILEKVIDDASMDSTFHVTARGYQGGVDGKLRLAAPKNPDSLMGPIELAKKSQGALQLTINTSMAKDILCQTLPKGPGQEAQFQQMFIKSGWLTAVGGNYQTTLTLKDAKIFANGHLVADLLTAQKTPAATAQKS